MEDEGAAHLFAAFETLRKEWGHFLEVALKIDDGLPGISAVLNEAAKLKQLAHAPRHPPCSVWLLLVKAFKGQFELALKSRLISAFSELLMKHRRAQGKAILREFSSERAQAPTPKPLLLQRCLTLPATYRQPRGGYHFRATEAEELRAAFITLTDLMVTPNAAPYLRHSQFQCGKSLNNIQRQIKDDTLMLYAEWDKEVEDLDTFYALMQEDDAFLRRTLLPCIWADNATTINQMALQKAKKLIDCILSSCQEKIINEATQISNPPYKLLPWLGEHFRVALTKMKVPTQKFANYLYSNHQDLAENFLKYKEKISQPRPPLSDSKIEIIAKSFDQLALN